MQARSSWHARFALLAVAAAVSACAAGPEPSPAPFAPEPSSRSTFVGTRPFAAGARLRFASFSLSSHERLLFQRCGDGCRTARIVGSWTRADFDRSPSQDIVLAEAGDYYLWLRQESPDGEIGPVQAAAATFDRGNGVLRFASGTVVFVAIDGSGTETDRADDPVRIATAPVRDETSELRKLESPALLERARHGVKQDLIVQIDPGETANALYRQALSLPGEDAPSDATAPSRRAAAWQRYRLALLDAKQRLLGPLRASGVELTQDLVDSATVVVSVSSEAGLRALQGAAQVTLITENHRLVRS
jgi:hypothetical protein